MLLLSLRIVVLCACKGTVNHGKGVPTEQAERKKRYCKQRYCKKLAGQVSAL
jgi:hypothetical protein